MYESTRHDGLRPRGEAPDHARHLRALVGLLRRLLRARPAGAHQDRRGLRRRPSSSFDFVVTPTSPSVAFELGARTDDPLAMYLSDYCTVPMSLAGIPAISIPAGLAQPGGGGPELPVGFQIAGPAFSETRLLDAAYALEQRDRLRHAPAVDRSERMTWASDRPQLSDEEMPSRRFRRPSTRAARSRSRTSSTNVAVLVEDSHPTEDLMGIYDPTGGLQRIVIFRDTHPSRRRGHPHRPARGRALLRRRRAPGRALGALT